jgi:DeoR family myo-inositol catabolism operon transcriptional repressor
LNLKIKKIIAKISRSIISDYDVIFISGGTTTQELAKLLTGELEITVFTNAINILLEIYKNNNLNIKFVGGDFRRKTLSTIGIESIEFIKKYDFDKCF